MPAPKGKRLTPKQKRFCEEYLVDLNGTQAAIRAGYSKNSANEIASQNLAKLNIQIYVRELSEKRSKRTEITADNVLREIALLGFSDIRQIFTGSGALRGVAELSDEIAAAVQSVEVVTSYNGEEDDDGNKIPEHTHKIKLADKKGSLELLGRHLKLFTDKVEHSGSVDLSGHSDSELQAIIERGEA